MPRIIFVSLALIGVAACANTASMRTVSRLTAQKTSVVAAQMNEFIEAQQQLNTADADELVILSDLAAKEQRRTALFLSGWTYAGRAKWLATNAAATDRKGPEIVEAMAVLRPRYPSLDDGGASAKLVAASGEFVRLGSNASTITIIKEIYDSITPIYQAIQTVTASAKNNTAAATATTVAAAKAVSVAGAN